MYLWSIRAISLFSFRKNYYIIYCLSFPETSTYLLDFLSEKYPTRLTIIYTEKARKKASFYQDEGIRTYSLDSLSDLFLRIVPTISGSQLVLCDNYFAFLAGIKFSREAKVVQLWHANGAIKNFGLEANYTKKATKRDRKRYAKVYKKFTHYVISSQKMAEIFTNSYKIEEINTLPFGYPPTDQYFYTNNAKEKFKKYFPTTKKTLLYVPTYREKNDFVIDYHYLADQLGKDWQLFLKLHPHDFEKMSNESQFEGWIIDFKNLTLSEMLPNIDCLVTDYSSIPFEYSLAKADGKMVFYCEDIDKYQQTVGLQADVLEWLPGEVVKDKNELVRAINNNEWVSDLVAFNQLWNTYANGDAVNQFLEWMEKNDK